MLDKRIFYGGIGIAIVWLAFLAVPAMWLRNVNHPLTANAAIDVCAYMSEAVLATLPQAPVLVERGMPGDPDTGKPACRLELPAERGVAKPPSLWVAVTTERMLSVDRRPLRTDRYVDTWLRESEASGSEVTPIKGPWRRAGLIRERMRPNVLSLLADDAGLVVWVNGQGIADAEFVAFAEAITRGLRDKRGAASAR